jgi:hypothetical protein
MKYSKHIKNNMTCGSLQQMSQETVTEVRDARALLALMPKEKPFVGGMINLLCNITVSNLSSEWYSVRHNYKNWKYNLL